MIKLIRPTKEYEQEVFAFKQDMIDAGDSTLNGCGSLDRYDTFEAWIAHIDSYKNRDKIATDSGYVEGSQWLLVDDEAKRILGMANIRHYLNDHLLREGGHIGYSIRPSERGKGYGRLQLKLSLNVLKDLGVTEALITCDDDNVASYRTIESCGGILENKLVVEGQKTAVRRYWITLVK
jgi:predicted acetyltransferase